MASLGRDDHDHQGPEPADDWFEKLPDAKPKFTKLRIYIHDILEGKDPTVVTVSQANVTATSPTQFGSIRVVDDPLTLGPELDSELVGRLEGLYVSASKDVPSTVTVTNFLFTEGNYKGSALSVLGCVSTVENTTEFPVVGGSGLLRLAQGVVTAERVVTGDGPNITIECRFKLMHY